jgi:hypothetical protein
MTAQFQYKQFLAATAAVVVLEVVQILESRMALSSKITRMPMILRWPTYAAITFGIILFGVYRETQFIYFQF